MGALIKKAKLESGRHSFEASGPSLPFRTVNQAGGIARCCRHNQASWPECLFMALMRHAGRARQCLLLGVQRTRCAHFEFFRS